LDIAIRAPVLPAADRLDGGPHGSALAAAQGLGGLLIHGDDTLGVADFSA